MANDKGSKTKSEYVMGQCPKCKSLDVTYGKEDLQDDVLVFPGECNECGCNFQEKYLLNYLQTDYAEEDA